MNDSWHSIKITRYSKEKGKKGTKYYNCFKAITPSTNGSCL
jgi:hypothetical protein